MKDRDGNEWRLVPINATDEMIADMLAAKDFDSIWPAAIAAAPQFVAGEVDNAIAHRIAETVFGQLGEGRVCADDGRKMITAVRSELGPALGLVDIREPKPEECERICTEYERLLMREGTCGGRDAFDAVRAVMWPKEGL